jgi:cytosine/adenosine deaminase-related metal-dependent hydrolase
LSRHAFVFVAGHLERRQCQGTRLRIEAEERSREKKPLSAPIKLAQICHAKKTGLLENTLQKLLPAKRTEYAKETESTHTAMSRTLVTNAHVITVEPSGSFIGDVLLEGDTLAALGPNVGQQVMPGSAQVMDASGCIVAPGFVNAHMHTWQTGLRGLASNWTLLEYFKWVHAGLATRFTPDDIYLATLVGAWNQINCGTTTLVDWCHNNPTPAHTDAALRGLEESGIRAAFFHGSPKPDPKPGEKPFWEVPHPRSEIERLLKHWPSGRAGERLSLGMAILGPHYSTLEVALADFALAKEMKLIASMHQGGGDARAPDGWEKLEAAGLLGPHINIVHGNNLTDAQLARFVGLGMSFSLTAENEMTQGHGHPITRRLLDLGAAPSLGADLESGLSGEMFLQARIALTHQRALDNAAWRASQGGMPPTSTITTAQALRWVTIEGAKMLGQESRIGSLAVGKQADLIVVDASLPNMAPLHDPVNALVMQTSLANVRDVMVAGQWMKREGKLLIETATLIAKQAALAESGKRIAQLVTR